jgi:hypothetical protein
MKTNLIQTILAFMAMLPAGIHRINIHGQHRNGAWIITAAPKGQLSGGWTLSTSGHIDREAVAQAEIIAEEYSLNPA